MLILWIVSVRNNHKWMAENHNCLTVNAQVSECVLGADKIISYLVKGVYQIFIAICTISSSCPLCF